MNIYLQLLMAAFIPLTLTVLFFLLQRNTGFGKMPEWSQQLIIGILFGGAAVFGTEFGVQFMGATINARDAAPLCAGLLFGAPAGVIAGVIGGVERWFSVLWGAGAYSRLACSISTILAGVLAAILRKRMFDDKRPTAGIGFFIAVVMEVLHLTILFLTHFSDAENAFSIIEQCALPMILVNAISVLLSIVVVELLTKETHVGTKRIRTISQKVQTAMLVCVVLAYFFTTAFVYLLQTNSTYENVNSLLTMNIDDVKNDIQEEANRSLLTVTRRVRTALEEQPDISLISLANIYNVTEINVVDEDGIIQNSTEPAFLDFDMKSGAQSLEFMVLNEGTDTFIQDYQEITFSSNDVHYARKYAGAALKTGGFVQIGYDLRSYRESMLAEIDGATDNRHIGANGYVMIANSEDVIVSDSQKNTGKSLKEAGVAITRDVPQYERMTGSVFGVDCFWMYAKADEYHIIAVYPMAEAMATRDAYTYVNSFMEVLVFAALFALIYFLIKALVVNNIRSVNKNLEQIIGGNLNILVNVRSSSEFASLSDDINSTVTTLKHYIAEAAARIDKELEFAKNIQLSSLPSNFPAYPNILEFDIRATMDTAKEVGGDFYDFYMLGDEKLAFLIADVSGKGIPAAMFMMRAKTMIKNFAEEDLPVNEILTRANEKLCEGNDAGMFVTAWMGILNIHTGHVTFANAGHNPPMIYREGEGYTYLRSRAGFVLAGMEGVRYKMQEFDLFPGDRLYLYTDGVTEATDLNKELYGEDRLEKYLNANVNLNAENALLGVKKDIDAFVGEAEQFDDITMVMVDYFGKGEKLAMIDKEFPAKTEQLDNVLAFIDAELEKADCGMKTATQINIAVEEIFVNIAHYAYGENEGMAKVSFGVADGMSTIRFEDTGKPFDPLAKQDPDITLAAEDRAIGGLGIFMVKKTMDNVTYQYKDGKNILTIMKRI